ncbi:inositol monophosphatase family protein [Streptomyces roseoverticillatus]|uniref:inositol monophosphatase family protein n=1 Tax=Streptomyces roseoverticillatus TaxID=66429 RepID=UPI0033C1083C
MINSCAGLDDAEVAIAAARVRADVVRAMYGQRLTRIGKGAGDFATAADVPSEKTILGIIHAARPNDSVLGEEGGQQGARDAARQWLVDPPFPSAPGFRAVDVLAHHGFVERFRPRVVSTTLAPAWVASGKRAAYITDGGDLSDSVHFAAGIALCRAAGCIVTGIDSAPTGQAGGGLVVTADAETHRLLMSMIRSRN